MRKILMLSRILLALFFLENCKHVSEKVEIETETTVVTFTALNSVVGRSGKILWIEALTENGEEVSLCSNQNIDVNRKYVPGEKFLVKKIKFLRILVCKNKKDTFRVNTHYWVLN